MCHATSALVAVNRELGVAPLLAEDCRASPVGGQDCELASRHCRTWLSNSIKAARSAGRCTRRWAPCSGPRANREVQSGSLVTADAVIDTAFMANSSGSPPDQRVPPLPPADHYLGLTLDHAQQVADAEGRHVENITGAQAVTADLNPRRVRVIVDDGRVVKAYPG